MTMRSRIARALHTGSDHQADGSYLGSKPWCNCYTLADRLLASGVLAAHENQGENDERAGERMKPWHACSMCMGRGYTITEVEDGEYHEPCTICNGKGGSSDPQFVGGLE